MLNLYCLICITVLYVLLNLGTLFSAPFVVILIIVIIIISSSNNRNGSCNSCGVVGWCEGVMYLVSPGRPTDIGLQLGKACYR